MKKKYFHNLSLRGTHLTLIVETISFLIINVFFIVGTGAQPQALPNTLICSDASAVSSSEMWFSKRRPELLSLFEKNVYGKTPGHADSISSELVSAKRVFNGKGLMKQVRLKVYVNNKYIVLNLLEIMPYKINKPVACFVGLNFWGNQTVLNDTSIVITDKWMLDYKTPGIINHYATSASRGIERDRWCASTIIEHGYAVITCHSADIDEDRVNYSDGAQSLFYKEGQLSPDSGQWGTIGAWAWGLSRIYDYASTCKQYNPQKIIVTGHSRMGKAALWAAAQDTRFAAAISNNSGCGGASLSRNKKGERIADINKTFPHWFTSAYKKYNNKEDSLPVDQHELLALIAPRPLYVTSATDDEWSGPENEFLSASLCVPVYRLLLGAKIKNLKAPIPDKPQFGIVSYHLRTGKHDITPWDWQNFLKFAENYVQK
jgi:hypothetical protein